MEFFSASLVAAVKLIFAFDPEIYRIMWTSVRISISSALLASFIGIPLGALITIYEFHGKKFLQVMLNSLMALPTVTIGLIFYGLLSRNGPMGDYGLLYTQMAVILGECVLILPIVVNLTISAIQSADERLLPTLKMLGASQLQQLLLVLRERRVAVLCAVVTGFGRAIGEVGVAMMLGGNIAGVTRTMTTAIALETNKGEFEFALALGLLLLSVAFAVNGLLQVLRRGHE